MGQDVDRLLDQIEELPPLPAVAARVMALADSDRTSALDLAQVLSTDQALTAKLIKVSNSAYYGFARRVSTVREAVLVLGFKQVRQMAVGASIMSAFKSGHPVGGFDLDLFWGHSVAVAVAAETFARKSRVCKPEDAFTAGILHDIGRLVLLRARPAEFGQAVALARSGACDLHEAETALLGLCHDAVGRALGERWKFPGHLVEAIGTHHDRSLLPEVGLPGVIAQCNELVLHHGLYCGYDADGETESLPPVLADVEAACGGIDSLLQRAFAFIEAASGTPEHWYARAG